VDPAALRFSESLRGQPGQDGVGDLTTINPGGCAPTGSEHSVDRIVQTSICGRTRHLTDDNARPYSLASAKLACLSLGVPITQEKRRRKRK
jgi:hypothetical protein